MFNLGVENIDKEDIITSGKLSLETYYSRNFFNDRYTDAQGSYINYKDSIFLVFKGTTTYANWLTNLQSRIDPYSKKVEFHPGYDLVYKRFKSGIYDLIDYYTDIYKPIYITGHSAGAAIATRAAYDLGQYRQIYLITWASPRVGNVNFRRYFNKRRIEALRIYNYTDPVVAVPLLFQGYTHVGIPFNSGSFLHSMQRYYNAVVKKLEKNNG